MRIGDGFSWERSNGNELWDLVVVRNLFARCGSSSCLVSTAAVGQQFVDLEGSVFYVKMKWKIVTMRPTLIEVRENPRAPGPRENPRLCCGKVCADSAFCTPLFVELVWRALRTVVVMPEGCIPAGKPWCAMVTRAVSLKSEEGQEPGATEAVAKEVASHAERGTWDLSRVRELSEWMRHDAYSEVLVSAERILIGMQRPSNHSSS